MKVLFAILFLASAFSSQACLDLQKPTTVHIQNYDGPIYLSPSHHCANDFQLHHITKNNPGTTCDDKCDCVNKQLPSFVPINTSPQNSGTYYTYGHKTNTQIPPCNYNNNMGTTCCSSTNNNNYGTVNGIRIIIKDNAEDNTCETCRNNEGKSCNNAGSSCENSGTSINNSGTSCKNSGIGCNNDDTSCDNVAPHYNNVYFPTHTYPRIPSKEQTIFTYGNWKKNSDYCSKCGCPV